MRCGQTRSLRLTNEMQGTMVVLVIVESHRIGKVLLMSLLGTTMINAS